MKRIASIITVITLALLAACSMGNFELKDDTVITTQKEVAGTPLSIAFERGDAWFHEQRIFAFNVTITPQLAVWTEDTLGNHLQTLFVTRGFATQGWKFTKQDSNECIRTMCMPYWFNKYKKAGNAAPTIAAPLPDAVTGATPTGSFTLNTNIADTGIVVLYVELNKSFDHNEAYGKDREASKFNGQPPVVYAARIDLFAPAAVYELKPVGHSGETGDDPALYDNTDKLTDALKMVKTITITAK